MKTIIVVESVNIANIVNSHPVVKMHVLVKDSKRATQLMKQHSSNSLVNVLQGNVHDLLEQLCMYIESPIEFHFLSSDEKSIEIARKRSREGDVFIFSDRT